MRIFSVHQKKLTLVCVQAVLRQASKSGGLTKSQSKANRIPLQSLTANDMNLRNSQSSKIGAMQKA